MFHKTSLVLASLGLLSGMIAAGDELEYPAYVKTSASSRAYLRMCPADGYRTDSGQGYVYLVQNAPDDSLLYTVDWFAGRSEVYLTNRGHHLVRLWSGRSCSRSSAVAISFYKDGRLIKNHLKRDLPNMDRPPTREPEFDGGFGERFRLFTPGHSYLFDVQTGELIAEGLE